MNQGARRRTGRNEAQIESAEMRSCRHVCGGFTDPNADICVYPIRPGTDDRATYIFDKAVNKLNCGQCLTTGVYTNSITSRRQATGCLQLQYSFKPSIKSCFFVRFIPFHKICVTPCGITKNDNETNLLNNDTGKAW